MERAILVIVLMVALVGVVGLFSNSDFFSGSDSLTPTGNVIAGSQAAQDCTSCTGYAPVCAKFNNYVLTFPNRCEAECAGATVVAEIPCQNLPVDRP